MKVLIIGYSDIVKRKIIPSIQDLSHIKSFDVATRKNQKINENKLDKIFNSYEKSLEESDADIVYISLPNNMHYQYSDLALKKSKHVIVDKPAITKISELDKLYNLSKQKNLAISMSCVFNYHKAWKKFKSLSLKNNEFGVLTANFTIPKPSKNNIRMSRSLGGGALNDLGIYASTSGYLFWEKKLKNIKISEYKKNNLNMGFTVLANYGNGKDFIGNFGFDKVYMNNVKYFGRNFNTEYKRVFSPHLDYQTFIEKETNRDKKIYDIGVDDTFKKYLKNVTTNLNKNKVNIRNEFYKLNLEYLNYLN